MERYDIAIIGTGPAGVSAAITAKVRNKSVLLLGSRALTQKLRVAHTIRNYPGFPEVSGQDLAEALLKHLDVMEIPITEKRVNQVFAMGDWFSLQCGEEFLEARTVILATGVVAAKQLPGEEELLGRGVSYCATCDASLYRGRRTAVIGYQPKEEEEAAFLSELSTVTYFPMYPDETHLPESVQVVREKPVAIEKDGSEYAVVTKEGRWAADGVFVLRDSVAPGHLVPGLETEGAHVKCDKQGCTNLPGLFACGDIAGQPYQYIKAAGEGNVAALSAVKYLNETK